MCLSESERRKLNQYDRQSKALSRLLPSLSDHIPQQNQLPSIPFTKIPLSDPEAFNSLNPSLFKTTLPSALSAQPIWNENFGFNILKVHFLSFHPKKKKNEGNP
jgi:hypothetical protein